MAETIIRIATITSAILRRRASLAASAALLATRAASHVAAAASRAISGCSRLDTSLRDDPANVKTCHGNRPCLAVPCV